MAQFVNKLRDCVRTVNLTMLLVLNLFFFVTLNLTVVTVLVVSEADHGFFIQDGSVSIGGALVILYASCILMAVSLVVAIRLVLIKPIKNIIQAMNRLAAGDFTVRLQPAAHGYEPTEIREFKAAFNKAAEELSGSVLLLNRIEAQTILTDCTDFSLDEQLRQCILVTRQKWRDKPLQFEAELAPCTYHGSEALVKEIWLNLLDNAAKFSPENGTISVTLHCEQGRPVVAVTDQGCGMDAETCCHIFEQFYQGDTSHRTQGNGLGLAMAQKIAALHGGAVTVDSRPGSGSCFTVVLK